MTSIDRHTALRMHQPPLWDLGLTVATLFLVNTMANAQWSADPNDPMVVCDAPNAQAFEVKALSDGADGWYVFWTDLRNGPSRRFLYGQHFNNDGIGTWIPNGKFILNLPGSSVTELAPVRLTNGNVMLAVLSSSTSISNADTVRAILVDGNGDPVWPSPALLSVSGPGIFNKPMGVASGDGAYFAYNAPPNSDIVVQRVRADGTVAFAVPGLQVPAANPNGFLSVLPDGAGGVIIGWGESGDQTNRSMRMDSLGAALWSAPLDHTAGSAGDFLKWRMIPDETGSFVSVWDVSGDIGMERLDTTGSLLWTPAPYYACTALNEQLEPSAAMSAGDLFVAWFQTNRIRLQKFDLATGAPHWIPEGLTVIMATVPVVAQSNIIPSDSGAVIGMMRTNGALGYCARRMRNDGTPAWSSPVPLALANVPSIFPATVELPDGDGGLVSFWPSSQGNLYGARINRDGSYPSNVGIPEREDPPPLVLYPNPASDNLTVQAAERVQRLEIWSADGRPVLTETPHAAWSDIALTSLPSGLYTLRTFSTSGVQVARFIKP